MLGGATTSSTPTKWLGQRTVIPTTIQVGGVGVGVHACVCACVSCRCLSVLLCMGPLPRSHARSP